MDQIESILSRVTQVFQGVSGVDAVVLGGSRATGTAGPGSDIDIGIYYKRDSFDWESFRRQAAALDDEHREDAITKPGEWGPWINGGGWLKIDGIAVDILFRELEKVTSVIGDCLAGRITVDYQCGHPFGFVNAIYMGEAAYCKVLSGGERLREQKRRLAAFPESYRRAAAEKFLWECEFSLQCGRKAAAKQDVLYAAGSLFRCAVSLLQVLYAVNRLYMLNEKGALHRLQRLQRQEGAWLPENFSEDMEAALSNLGRDAIRPCFDTMQRQLDAVRRHCTAEGLVL